MRKVTMKFFLFSLSFICNIYGIDDLNDINQGLRNLSTGDTCRMEDIEDIGRKTYHILEELEVKELRHDPSPFNNPIKNFFYNQLSKDPFRNKLSDYVNTAKNTIGFLTQSFKKSKEAWEDRHNADQEQIAELTKESKRLKKENVGLTKTIATLSRKKDNLSQQIKELSKSLTENREELEKLQKTTTDQEQIIAKSNKKTNDLKEQITDLLTQLNTLNEKCEKEESKRKEELESLKENHAKSLQRLSDILNKGTITDSDIEEFKGPNEVFGSFENILRTFQFLELRFQKATNKLNTQLAERNQALKEALQALNEQLGSDNEEGDA